MRLDETVAPSAEDPQIRKMPLRTGATRFKGWIGFLRRDSISIVAHAVVATLVAVPLVRPGYLLLLDFTLARHVRVHWRSSDAFIGPVSSAPFESFIWLLHKTGPLAAFLVVFLLVFGCGYAMNRAVAAIVPRAGATARITAGVLYAVNPFTYVRLVHGQINVLAAMAVLPLVTVALVRVRRQPTLGRAAALGLTIAAVGFTSVHVAGMLLVLIPVLLVVVGWPGFRPLLVAGVVALAASSWWLVQAAFQPLPPFTGADLDAFATQPRGWTSAGHVAALYGFWRFGEFPLPRDGIWVWPLTFAPIAILIVWGAVRWFKIKRSAAIGLAGLAVAGIILAAGASFPPTAGAFRWLYRNVPGFTVYREPQKWSAVVLFAYAGLASPAVSALTEWTDRGNRAPDHPRLIRLESIMVAATLLGIVLFYGRTMIMNTTTLRTSSFPADWYAVNERINQQPARVLVFPWHMYMTFDFTGRRIANPAPVFFDAPVLASEAPDHGSIRAYSRSPDSLLVERALLKTRTPSGLLEALSKLCTPWIVLFKAADWEGYNWLETSGLYRTLDGPTIRLYRVPALRCSRGSSDSGRSLGIHI